MFSTFGMKGLRVFAVLAVGTFSACGGVGRGTGTDVAGPPTFEELANATYSGIIEQPVQLVDGRWDGEPFVEGGASRPSAGLVDRFSLHGDLDGDGLAETIVLLWETSGGSGTRDFLAVTARKGGGVSSLATALIGDRVQVKSGRIADRQITLDLVRAGPEDAACCPSERAQVVWVLTENGLERAAEEVSGTLSLSDLEGPEWALEELGRDRPVPDGVKISLLFDGDKVTGTGGCNRYFGTVTSLGPGDLSFGGMGTTMMACPEPAMETEQRYLKTLAGASSYSFLGGRLVVGCETENGHVALIFSPEDSPEHNDAG